MDVRLGFWGVVSYLFNLRTTRTAHKHTSPVCRQEEDGRAWIVIEGTAKKVNKRKMNWVWFSTLTQNVFCFFSFASAGPANVCVIYLRVARGDEMQIMIAPRNIRHSNGRCAMMMTWWRCAHGNIQQCTNNEYNNAQLKCTNGNNKSHLLLPKIVLYFSRKSLRLPKRIQPCFSR